jgi:hypothetical protein
MPTFFVGSQEISGERGGLKSKIICHSGTSDARYYLKLENRRAKASAELHCYRSLFMNKTGSFKGSKGISVQTRKNPLHSFFVCPKINPFPWQILTPL